MSLPLPSLRPVCETMEERILHSADLAPLLVSDVGSGLALQQPVQQQTSANEPLARIGEIAFVDLSVPDAGALLADLRSQQAAGRALEIVTIAADEDGLARIGQTLAGRSDIGAVHVLAHGSDGTMQLGHTRLDADTLLTRADAIAAWSGALTVDADLLLYGCDFAQSGVGQQLVRDLALLTGADVAASTDLTGAAAMGGNWTLEAHTGYIEATILPSTQAQTQWQATLALLASDPMGTSGNLSGSGGGTGWAGNWSGGGSSIRLSSGSLSDPSGLLPASGGKAQFQLASLIFPSTATAARDLGGDIGADGTTTWISFVIQPDTGGINYAGVQFGSSSATVGFAGFNNGQFVIGEAGTAGNAVAGTNPVNGQNALLVVKLEHAAGNDTLTLYVNPTPGLTTPDSALTASASIDLGSFRRIAITGSTVLIGSNTSVIDEIRVGQSYADVAPTAAPVITSNGGGATAGVSIAENTTHVTTVAAIDYDTASLTYSIAGGADAALFQIDAGTGVLRFQNAPDFETPLSAAANNIYDVIVRASDGTLSDDQAIAVTVTDVSGGPIIVSTTSDVYDGNVGSIELLIANPGADGLISLREAITAANNTPGTDTITFGVNGTFTLSSIAGTGDDNNDKGDLDLKDSLVIVGNGSGNTIISGFGTDRVFDLRSGAGTVAMSGLTIQGGGGEDGGAMRIDASVTVTLTDVVVRDSNGNDGGAIYNQGSLTITRGVLSGNTAVNNDGGAIFNTGTLVLDQVELANNSATGSNKGGALYNKGTATLTDVWAYGNSAEDGGALWMSGIGNNVTLTNVTLNANAASKDGGAIYGEAGGRLNATNVTISGNSAGEHGGAIRGKTTNWSLASATIADNHATLGAGAIHADDNNAVRLKSTILASNTSGAGASINVSNRTLQSQGHNLATQSTSWLDHPQDIISTSVALKLEALAANGGFAPTHALLLGSTAIDMGDSSALTDQRGVARVGTADIGAYEYNLGNSAPTVGSIANQTTAEDTALGPLAFTIDDLESGPDGLIVTATSLNNGLLPQAGIVLGGTGANRTITLAPAANANSVLNGGSVTVRISVSDGVNTTLRDFLLTVNPVADDPVAVDDLASTPAATTVVVAVLGNDDDVDGDSFVIDSASLQDGTQGSLGFDNNTITFTPGPAVTGAVLINYTVRDSTGRISNTAVLTVNVGANNAPTAAGGMVALNEDTSRAIVLANLGYGDPDGHAFAALRVDGLPTAGSLWFNGELVTSAGLIVNAADLAAGKLVFTPATNANGATYATLQFSVQDSVGAYSASSATLTFNVVAQSDAPIAVDDAASTPINQPIDVNVLANDNHPDGGAVSYAITGVALDDPSLGSVSISYALDARGSVLFTPTSNISGEVVIRYTITDDATTPASSVGTLRVTVGVNTAPSSANNTVSVAEDGSYTVQVADIGYADADAGQSFAALRVDQLPQFGILYIAGVAAQIGDSITAARLAAGDLVYQPQTDGNGPGFDQFLFSVVDSADTRSVSYTLTIDVTPVNDAPVASGGAVLPGVTEDAPAPDGATVGSLFSGNFSDTRDAGNPGQNQLAGIAVVGQNLVPTQGRWQYSIDGGLLWNDFGGTLSDSAAVALRDTDWLRFLPGADFNGTPDDLTVRLIDNAVAVTGGAAIDVSGHGGTSAFSAATVSLSTSVGAINDAPTIVAPGSITVVEDLASPLTGIVFADVDAGAGIVTANFGVASGSLSATSTALVTVGGDSANLTLRGTLADINLFLATNQLRFTTALDATASVTLTITIDDEGHSGVDPGASGGANSEATSKTVTLVATAVNDAPTLTAPATLVVIEDAASPITGIVFADVDAGSGAVVASFGVASGTLGASPGNGVAVAGAGTQAMTLTGSIADINAFIAAGNLRFTTASGATADVALTITINDGGHTGTGVPETATVNRTLTVSPLNKAPQVSAPALLTAVEDVPGAITTISFSDPDAGNAIVNAGFSVDSGTLAAIAGNGVAVTGSGTQALVLSGSIADLNAFIANGGIGFTTAQDANANVTLRSTIDDGGNTGLGGARSAFATSTIVVTPVNDAPVLAAPWADQAVVATQAALLQIPPASFTDPDAGDSLRYAATLADGSALPAWLQFDPLARSFSADAALADVGTLTLRVTATDDAGASAQMVFRLSVVAPTPVAEPVEPEAAAPVAAPANSDDTDPPAPVEAVEETAAEPAPTTDLEIAIEPPPALIASDPVEIDIDTRITVAAQRQFTFEVAATLPVSQADAVLAAALQTQFSDIATSSSSEMFTNEDLLRKLEELKRQMLLQQESAQQTVLASSIALTSGLSIGYVVWLIRGGILVSSMLSALPAWQLIDPLPVLATARGGRPRPGTAPAEDPEVEKLFDRKRKAPPGNVPPAPPPTATRATQNPTSP